MQCISTQKAILYLKIAYSEKPRLGRRILGKLMQSLGKRYSKPFNIQPLGEIYTVDDAPFPKMPELFDENGDELELNDQQKALIDNINESKQKMTHSMLLRVS